MNSVSLSDEALLQAVIHGNQDAWTDLVGRYHRRAVRHVMYQVTDLELARDIVQNTWESVWTAIKDEPPRNFNSFFRSVLQWRLIDAIRSKKRKGTLVSLDEPRVTGDGEIISRQISSDTGDSDPIHGLVANEDQELFWTAMHSLPHHYQVVIRLHGLEGRSFKETTRIMVELGLINTEGDAQKKAQNYFYRGLEALGERLLGLGYEWGGDTK